MRAKQAALVVFVVSLAAYLATLAPTVTLVDSGELIVAAWSLGVAHPPGFPLYVLLAHLATLAPLGEVAARVNFASALFGALAAAAVALAAAQIVRPRLASPRAAGKRSKPMPTAEAAPAGDAALVALTAGAMLAFGRAFWSFATIAEVYTLNTLLVALVLLVVLRWRADARAGERQDRHLVLAAGLFGLALGVHHVTVLAWAPGLALLVWKSLEGRRIGLRTLGWMALAGLAGLAVYAYLPLAAARSPLLNWGDPDSPGRLFRHVSGWIYQTNLSAGGAQMGHQAGRLLGIVVRQYGPAWLPLGLGLVALGVARLARRDRTLLAALGLVAATATAYALAYDIAEDTEAYYLPVFVVFALAAGAGAAGGLEAARRRGRGLLAPFAVGLVVAVALVGNFSYTNYRRDFVARDYVRNILAAIEPHGMLLTEDWQVYSPLLYTLEVARLRPDVIAVDVNLLRRSWYVESMQVRYPGLFAAAGAEVRAYLGDLRAWEADPGAFARDPRLSERIDRRFSELIVALATAQAGSGPVYVTQELVIGRSSQAAAIGAKWQTVPQGLVFRLYADREFHDPPAIALATESLTSGSRRTDPDDVVELKVRPAYTGMLVNRGLYLAAHGQLARAREATAAALALDPENALAHRLASQLANQVPGAPRP